jgi:hypothetical protein
MRRERIADRPSVQGLTIDGMSHKTSGRDKMPAIRTAMAAALLAAVAATLPASADYLVNHRAPNETQ